MPPDNEHKVEIEVAGLQVEVRNLRQAVDRGTESLSGVREGFQRLRGEMNGVLPRLEKKVERVIDQLDGHAETEREYFEKVSIHDRELETLFGQLGKKADTEANRDEHARLWIALRVFFYGTLTALIGLLLVKVFG